MSKMLKSLMRDELKDRFAGIDGGVFISTEGLDSEKTYAFRASLRAKNIRYTVVRNALAREAFSTFGYDGARLGEVLKGAIGVAYTSEENSAAVAAKAVDEWKRETRDKIVQWKGAVVEGTVLGAAEAEQLKDAPTKDQARAMLLGVFQAPLTQFLGTIREPGARVVYLLKALADKREEAGEKAAG